ncbi:hypothetical protein Val02_70790 [Virgisporangium aliadipatigenens]|uniref:Uncharacterized protein n=1 Tax=Virgisporangium aliadipatigenens TaxID=741659 RepID=A0A8J3YTK5_9ACTN|nr:EAL domain-containing protein [Virgisporangium aliadipatigenens]GIJ50193.1 hypothetical protein Val02_70790 [Virgisporangium aliadipatigenens]
MSSHDRRLVWLLCGVVLLSTVLFAFALAFGSPWPRPLDHLLNPVAAALAALLCRRAWQRSAQPRVRRFWRHSAWGMAFVTAAFVVRVGFVATSFAALEPFWIGLQTVGAALLCWAVLRVPLALRSRAERVALALDLGTLMIAAAIIVWHFFGTTALRSLTGGAAPNVGPIMGGSLVAVFLASKAALAGSGAFSRGVLSWRALGALSGGLGSAVGALLAARPDVDAQVAIFPIASLATGVSAYRQLAGDSASGPVRPRRRRYSILPYAGVVVVDALLVWTAVHDTSDHLLVVLAAVVVTAIVVVRQLVAFGENDSLLNRLGRQEQRLRHEATHDALTGLANRTLFHERVQAALTRPDRKVPPSVALIDLDDFKTVNDTLGHTVGDGLLVAIAERMRASVRAEDTVARLGGDEFAILFEARDADAVDAALDRLAEAVQMPVQVDEHLLVVAASFGVVAADALDGADGVDLLRCADIAMYQAKAHGRGGYERYRPEMETRGSERVQVAGQLRTALDEGQFALHYQPVVRLADGRPVGAEALVRWQHPERGLLGPHAFVAVAEETGLIVPLGRFVLREATRQAAEWIGEHGAHRFAGIAVNVSARQLQRTDFAGDVAAALDAAGLPPHRLTIEITESTAVGGGATQDSLRELRALGVRISLDDFGTGQSTLSLLATLPIDQIKLDRSFVPTPGHEAIADAVIRLATGMGIEAVAEGVETAEHVSMLRGLGYHLAQGYHFARPMPAGDLAELLARELHVVPAE